MRPPAALLDQLDQTRLLPITMARSASVGKRLLAAFRSRGWSFVSLTDDENLADIFLARLRSLGVLS